jgi:putative acetyltransferase
VEIKIRHIEKSDIEAIKAIYDQPHVIDGTLQQPYQSVDIWQSRFAGLKDFIGLVAVVDGRVVGQLGLHAFDKNPRRKHVATLVVAVCSSVQGKGVANALVGAGVDLCDNWLNIRRIELQVFVDNERAISLYRKHGFEMEGELKAFAFRAGRYVDAYAMSRIRAV